MKRAGLFFILSSISIACLAVLPTGSNYTTVAVPLFTYDYVQSTHLPSPYESFVHVPQYPWGFIVGVTGMYLEHSSTGSDLDYAQVLTDSTMPDLSLQLKNIDPDHTWNWGANAGVIFPNTSNDLSVSFIDFDDNQTRSLQSPDFLISTVPAIAGIQNLLSKAEFKLTQWDVTLGQQIYVGNRFNLHPKAGVRFGEVSRKITSIVINPPDTVPLEFLFQHQNSDFDGIGPLVGADVGYYLVDGISIVGHFDSALLVGHEDHDVNAIVGTNNPDLPGADDVLVFSGKDNSSRIIVPTLDGKLGVNYTYSLNNKLLSSLSFEAGYQVIDYFDVTRLLRRVATGQGRVAVVGLVGTPTNNFQLNGLYLNLSVTV